MVWQDIVFAVGAWIFFIALIPSIRNDNKPALSTSATTGVVLFVYTLTFATMELWLSVFSSLLTASAWITLAIQKYRQN